MNVVKVYKTELVGYKTYFDIKYFAFSLCMRTKFIEYVDNNQERMIHIILIGNKIYLKNQPFFNICNNIQLIPNPSEIVDAYR